MSLEAMNEKWKRNTVGKADKWAERTAASTDKYVSRLAIKTGFSEAEIASGPMGRGFREFARNAPVKKDDFATSVEDAAAHNAWLRGFKRALIGRE